MEKEITIQEKLATEMVRFRGNSKETKRVAATYDLSLRDPEEKRLVYMVHAFLFLITDATMSGMFPVDKITITAFALITTINSTFDKEINFKDCMKRRVELMTPEERAIVDNINNQMYGSKKKSILYN